MRTDDNEVSVVYQQFDSVESFFSYLWKSEELAFCSKVSKLSQTFTSKMGAVDLAVHLCTS